MKCPYCSSTDDTVLETRTNIEQNFVKRTRQCNNCKKKWVTHETIEDKVLYVTKSGGAKELFDREKIIRGMEIACRKRPVSSEDIIDAAYKIYYKILAQGNKIVSSDLVGNYVCEELKQMDMVAYIRFASVYRKFESIEEFKKLIDEQ